MLLANQRNAIDTVFQKLAQHGIFTFQIVPVRRNQYRKPLRVNCIRERLYHFSKYRVVYGWHDQPNGPGPDAMHGLRSPVADIPQFSHCCVDLLASRKLDLLWVVIAARYSRNRNSCGFSNSNNIGLLLFFISHLNGHSG